MFWGNFIISNYTFKQICYIISVIENEKYIL